MSARSISRSELRVADIIVTTGDARISEVIRTGSGTDFSHTILYIGQGNVIESTAPGVEEHSLDTALKEVTLAVALRRRGMTQITQDAVVANARNFLSRKYDAVGAAGAGAMHKRGTAIAAAGCLISPLGCILGAGAIAYNSSTTNQDSTFFCSELVARAYELAGVPISDMGASFTSPRAVRVSHYLMYVGHLVGGP